MFVRAADLLPQVPEVQKLLPLSPSNNMTIGTSFISNQCESHFSNRRRPRHCRRRRLPRLLRGITSGEKEEQGSETAFRYRRSCSDFRPNEVEDDPVCIYITARVTDPSVRSKIHFLLFCLSEWLKRNVRSDSGGLSWFFEKEALGYQ